MAKQTQITIDAGNGLESFPCTDACKACQRFQNPGQWREFATCMENRLGMPWAQIQKLCVCGKISQVDTDDVVSNLTNTFPTDQSQVNSLEDCCRSTDCCGRLGGRVYGKPCFERCMKGLNCGFECDRFRVTPVGGGPSPQPVL